MCIRMASTVTEERLRWVMPIVKKGIRISEVCQACPHSQRSLERWVAAYRKGGEKALEPQSTRPKTYRKQTAPWVRQRILEIRKRTKKCAVKIHWQLEKEGVMIHERTIGKILKQEGRVRKYRVKKMKYKYLKAERKVGELLEIDVKYVPGKVAGQRYYQYTAIDLASRWRHLAVYDDQSSFHSLRFLEEVLERFPYRIQAIKTDNGTIFTNYYTGTHKRSDQTVKTLHPLDVFCRERNLVHYLIDPGKPAQNGTVERSHREDQEKFYDQHTFQNIHDLQKKLKRWNIEYNNLEHCGLAGKTPNEFLAQHKITNPPNVRT
jgi:transposase InsO family protein